MNLPEFSTFPGAIAIDLDGTLLNGKGELSNRNRRAVERCISQGLPVVIATSRAERSVRRLIGKELASSCSLVMMNGAIARGNPPLSGSIRESIPAETARDIVGLILEMEPAVRITVELEGFEFGTNAQLEPDALWRINSATPEMVLSLEDACARIPSKISVNGMGKDLSGVARAVSQRFEKWVSVIPTADLGFLNIPSAKASKTNALRFLLGSQKLRLDEVLAFGDDIPDLDMLEACGMPVAVANAAPQVLAMAKYHTAGNDEDGVAIALERIFERGPKKPGANAHP